MSFDHYAWSIGSEAAINAPIYRRTYTRQIIPAGNPIVNHIDRATYIYHSKYPQQKYAERKILHGIRILHGVHILFLSLSLSLEGKHKSTCDPSCSSTLLILELVSSSLSIPPSLPHSLRQKFSLLPYFTQQHVHWALLCCNHFALKYPVQPHRMYCAYTFQTQVSDRSATCWGIK